MANIIDEKDKKILDILKEHSNHTTRQIAKKTLLPPTTINNRIRKLTKDKIIQKYTIIPDYNKIGKGQLIYVLISCNLLELKKNKRTQYDVVKDLKKHEFIERVDIVSGGTDIVAMIRTSDIKEYDKLLLKHIQNVDGIDKTQSLVVIH